MFSDKVIRPVFLKQRPYPLLTHMQARQFCPQIAQHLSRDTHIAGDKIENGLIRYPSIVQFEQWDAQPLLIKFCRITAVTARCLATNIGMMRDTNDEGNRLC